MIDNASAAEQVSNLMKEIFEKLDESCRVVEQNCSQTEYSGYLKATSKIANSIVFDVMEPLYEKHPNLKPNGWDDGDDRLSNSKQL